MKIAHIKNYLLKLFWFLSALLIAGPAVAEKNLDFYLQRIKQTCQCPYCHLQGIDLSGFKPGSTDSAENPFAATANTEQTVFPWLSCNFTGADLQWADLRKSNFIVSIRGYITPLAKADFSNANLARANLSESKFYGVDFSSADLNHAQLKNTELFLDNFSHADFTHASLKGAVSQVDAMHGWASDFNHANFSYADLSKAVLGGNFQQADFSHANLSGAKLTAAQAMSVAAPANPWQGANFSYTNLTKVQFGTAGEKKPDLSQAIFCHTTLPSGKISNRNCPSS